MKYFPNRSAKARTVITLNIQTVMSINSIKFLSPQN